MYKEPSCVKLQSTGTSHGRNKNVSQTRTYPTSLEPTKLEVTLCSHALMTILKKKCVIKPPNPETKLKGYNAHKYSMTNCPIGLLPQSERPLKPLLDEAFSLCLFFFFFGKRLVPIYSPLVLRLRLFARDHTRTVTKEYFEQTM